MSKIFGKAKSTINEHIKNILKLYINCKKHYFNPEQNLLKRFNYKIIKTEEERDIIR